MLIQRKNELSQLLRKKGYKITSQRKAVLDVVIENDGEHLSSQEIYELVKKKHPDVGIATIYRTLPVLEELGFVYAVDLEDGCIRYELNRVDQLHRHHHLLCERCGKVTEVKDDLLDEIEAKIYKNYGFTIKDHRVKFYGICAECQRKAL
ncbi:MAG: transcriptional repressor [Clostridiaceae bacterium]|nr:transcriptional repressor [Clostridiaceae bacterium]